MEIPKKKKEDLHYQMSLMKMILEKQGIYL